MGQIKHKKKKVLIINTCPTHRNGITNVILNYIKALDKNKISIGFVSINPISTSLSSFFESQTVETHTINNRISNPLKYIIELVSIAKNYDIIHAHGNSATLVLEMIAGKLAGTKLRIAHSHNTTCASKVIHNLLNPLFHLLCNKRLACGHDAGVWLFGKRDFTVLNNGIDCSKFKFNNDLRNKIRKSLNWQSKIIIGNVGNLNDQKNHSFLIKIFERSVKCNPELRLLVLGEGQNRKELETQIKSLKIEDKVNLIGNLPNVNEYLNALDLIAMPSLFEGLPLSLIEEQANGLRCLVSDTITTEVDKTNMISFIPLDEKLWIQSLTLSSVTDIDRNKTSEVAINKIKEGGFDINTEVKKLEDIYLY